MTKIQLLEQVLSQPDFVEATYLDATVRDGIFPSGVFQIALPKLWTVKPAGADKIPSADSPIIKLAAAIPGVAEALGASHTAQINVWCAFLPRVINGSDWLRRWTVTQGFDISDFRERPTANGIMGDAVALSRETGRLHRMITIKDGDLIYLVDGSIAHMGAPENPGLQEIALIAASRFQLLAPSGTRYAEPMIEQTLKNELGEAAFFLPQSWIKSAPQNTTSAQFTHYVGDTAAGTLSATLGGFDKTPLALEDALVAKLQQQGFIFTDAELILKAQKGTTNFSAFRRRGTTSTGGDYTLLGLRSVVDGLPLSIAVLSASADLEFESWAINRRTFEIILETFAVGLV